MFFRFVFFLLIVLMCSVPNVGLAQDNKYELAHSYFEHKDYEKAIKLYQELNAENPLDNEIYQDYLILLMATKDYKVAASLVQSRIKKEPNNPLHLVLLGHVLMGEKKDKKAEEQYEEALKFINGDDVLTQQIANSFANNNQEVWAIRCYERATQVTQIPGLYNAALAKLYNQKGDLEKAISLTIDGAQNQMLFQGDESIETQLLELIGKDPEKQKKAQKVIIKMVASQPDNFYYSYLLTWIFSVQDNWEQAYTQIAALEKRNPEKGKLMMDFGRVAAQKEQYTIAQKAFDLVKSYGATNKWYRSAQESILKLQLAQIQNQVDFSPEKLADCSKNFDQYFEMYPDAYTQPILQDYALLEAQYNNNLPKAIALLKQVLQQNMGAKNYIAQCKLQLGDYQIINGNIWEAALLYAQVDKAYREDALGEEARFRNAKLSYYQHDFEQAQGQLSVLKASTSELIANDALALSVLITENVPPDSNLIPLQRFSYADLLLFQNKDKEAEQLLDSLVLAFPKNPLVDDILFLRSKIALKHKAFEKSIQWLKQVVEQYGQDVLADDAVFQIAEIYRKYLHQPEQANRYYEQLIIDYPGSSFVDKARAALSTKTL